MRPRPGKGRATLRQGLDKEVYQVVRKIVDDRIEQDPEGTVTVYSVYDSIRRSNSSLKRKSKPLLEDSIERVLAVLQEEQDYDSEGPEAVEGDFAGIVQTPDDGNAINRIIAASMTPARLPTPTSDESKKRDGNLQVNGEPPRKKKKQAKESADRSPPKDISVQDLGGVDDVVEQLENLLVMPLLYTQEHLDRKLQPPRGILLHGPPGCGKTMLSKACAADLGVSFLPISAPSIVSGMSGESEKQLREHFEEAQRVAPCILFIDEIDAITPKRESAQREMEKRIVAQLLTCMDDLAAEHNGGKAVVVLAATNRPDSLDPALRRAGRFDKEINMGVPNEPAREKILRAQTRKMNIAEDVDFRALAKMTPGFVGADLNDLVSTAGSMSMNRFREALKAQAEVAYNDNQAMDIDGMRSTDTKEVSPVLRSWYNLIRRCRDPTIPRPQGFTSSAITNADFLAALPTIQPSSKREGFATIPDTTWSDIGALSDVRASLEAAIVEPIRFPEKYLRIGISTPTGVLLWGPPGCGKTLLAKAVANESRANFISVKGPELLNKYVGESERAVRQVFVRARSSIPCVIFFDELDALVPRRDDSLSEASSRVVNTLLTELDGLSTRTGIYVIAATNRPDIIDPAMLRPGRLETLLFVSLPGPAERVEILRAQIRKMNIDPELADIARRCEGYSGADLGSLVRKAGENAVQRDAEKIEREDFEVAMGKVRPSVRDLGKYEGLKERLAERI